MILVVCTSEFLFKLNGKIENSETAGSAMIAGYEDPGSFAVSYNALVTDEFKQIDGGYGELNDIGTFWIRREFY